MRRTTPFVSSCLCALALATTPCAQTPARPGPTYDGKDVQVVRRGAEPAPRLGARIALVVGIDRYEHLPELGYAEKDAKDVEQALTAVDFTVTAMRRDTRLSPARAESILAEISALCTAADPQDTLLVFLSGHGFSEPGGAPFFCAQFTDPANLAVTGLSLQEVKRRLEASKAGQKMLVVDACRNVPSRSAADRGLELPDFRADSLAILFSTSPGSRSWEPRGREVDRAQRAIENGIFTHYLLRGLAGEADGVFAESRDGWLTFRELAYYVGKEVKSQTRLQQKPYLDWVGEAGGDILMRRVAVAAEPVAAPVAAPVAQPPAVVPSKPEEAAVRDVSSWGKVLRVDPDPSVVTDAEARSKIVASGWPWRVEDKVSGIVMLLVPPGEFTMGSPANEPGRGRDEKQHRRRITKPFYLGETEVTQASWQRVMGDNPSRYQGSSNPVEQVSWDDIQPFLQKTGLVLPSEAQWEYACRARTVTAFSFGAKLTAQQANVGGGQTVPVGTLGKNAWGFADMHGNVWEWCADGYQSDYPGDGATEAPAGAGASRVLRGGSWFSIPAGCRAAYRYGYVVPAYRTGSVGFRAARTL